VKYQFFLQLYYSNNDFIGLKIFKVNIKYNLKKPKLFELKTRFMCPNYMHYNYVLKMYEQQKSWPGKRV